MNKFIFLTDFQSNRGYSEQVNAMAKTVNNSIVIDAVDLPDVQIPRDAIVVSAGHMGYRLYKEYCHGQALILATDRYSHEDLDALHIDDITIIAPQCELNKYTANNDVLLSLVAADLVACPDRSALEERVKFFHENNPDAAKAIAAAAPELFFFFGGRVSAPIASNPNRWLENSVELFELTAKSIMYAAGGDNLYVVFHGLRSRTRSDKSNDFAPQDAAIATMASMREAGQTVIVLATTANGSEIIVINDEGETRLSVKNDGACGYYAALSQAVASRAAIMFTSEQMNLTNEALTLGADWRNITPFGSEDGWELTVPANEETHESVFRLLSEGETPLTQVEAFRQLF